jgi:hypothetical protein
LIASAYRASSRLRRLGMFSSWAATAAWVCLALAATRAQAQTFDATNLQGPTDLAATWLVHAGDDPAYARPDFDDSQWLKFDSTKDLRDLFPHSQPEIVWYRLHVKVAPAQVGLALKEVNISRAFEVYSDGVLLIKLGQIKPFAAYTSIVPIVERIPDSQIVAGSVVLALRVHIASAEWSSPRPGFDAGPGAENLTLGRENELRQDLWLSLIGRKPAGIILNFFGVGLGLVALALFFSERARREYLWLALSLFVAPFGYLFDAQLRNHRTDWAIYSAVLKVAVNLFGILVYPAFLHMRIGRWIWAYWAAAAALVIGASLTGNDPFNGATFIYSFPFILVPNVLIPILLLIHLRRGNLEAGVLLIPSLLGSLSFFFINLVFFLYYLTSQAALATRMIRLEFWQFGPFNLSIFDLTWGLSLLAWAMIIVLRSTRMSRKQAVLEGELEAARQVQQVILPEAVETVPGFTVESVYQPARQVGGDFFQILPAGEGGLLVVVGDVAGKGLPAAMLVSVLVGAIRTAAAYSEAPDEVLAQLNERLVGRGGSLATALVARITADGQVTIAKAGHLSPARRRIRKASCLASTAPNLSPPCLPRPLSRQQ